MFVSSKNELFHPHTGKRLTLYACDTDSNEVYRAHVAKAVSVVAREYEIDEERAVSLLSHSGIDEPVKCDTCEFWVE